MTSQMIIESWEWCQKNVIFSNQEKDLFFSSIKKRCIATTDVSTSNTNLRRRRIDVRDVLSPRIYRHPRCVVTRDVSQSFNQSINVLAIKNQRWITAGDVSPPETYRHQRRIAARAVSSFYRHRNFANQDVSSPETYRHQWRIAAGDGSPPEMYQH